VLTATSGIAASNAQPKYSDELTFTLTQKLWNSKDPNKVFSLKTFKI